MGDAMRAVAKIMAQGHLPSAIEFLDSRCLDLIGEMLPFALPGGKPSLLLIELDGPLSQIGRRTGNGPCPGRGGRCL